jgi:hypothetical protein
MLSVLNVKADSPIESAVFGVGIGLGVMSYLVLAIGLLGFLYPWTLMVLVGVMGLVSIRDIVELLKDAVHGLRFQVGTKLKASSALITFSMVVLGALSLVSALAPPAGLDWDGLAYHLAVPKMYLAHHRVFYVPFLSHSNFPFLTEMLYALGNLLRLVFLPQLFHVRFPLLRCVLSDDHEKR